MYSINTATLRRWQRDGHHFILVDTLSGHTFAKAHLPGAISLASEDILDQASRYLPDLKQTIIEEGFKLGSSVHAHPAHRVPFMTRQSRRKQSPLLF